MKKLMKWMLILLGVFAVILLALVLILPRVFDPNEQKDKLEQAVTDATGRDFEIQGDIQWRVFPNIGFSAGPLILDNAAGFEAPQFARIGMLEVNVQLMPLFDGEVRVGAVEISGLELDLEVNQAGHNNWDDLADTGDSTSAGGAGSDTANLRIEGITLTDGVVRFRDQSAGIQVESTGISLNTSALELGQSLTTELQMSMLSEFWSGPMIVDLTLLVDDPLAADPGSLTVQSLEVGGNITPQLPLSFSLASPIVVDLGSENLSIEKWTLAVGPANLHGNVEIAVNDKGDTVFSGRFDLAPFDAREILASVAGSGSEMSNPESLSRVAAGGNWRLAGDTARLSELKIQLDETNITGQLKLDSIARLAGTAGLNIDRIDLDQYMTAAAESTAAPPSGEETGVSIPESRMTAELVIGHLRVAGMQAENVSLRFLSAGRAFKLTPIRAELYQGQMTGGVDFNLGGGKPLILRTSLKGIDAAPLMADLTGQALISGTGNLAVDISIADPFALNPLSGTNGKLEFRFKDGAVHGVDVMGVLRQAANLLGRGSEAFKNQDPATDFSSLQVSAVIDNGVLSTPNLSLKSPYLRITGDGQINLIDNTLDYVVEPVLVSTPAGQGGAGLEKLEGIAIPVTLSGSLEQPDWRVDPTALLLAIQGDKLGESATQILQALGGNKQNGDGEQADTGQDLLNALFNEMNKKERKKNPDEPDNG